MSARGAESDSKTSASIKPVQQVVKRYKRAKSVSMKVQKTLNMGLLDRPSKSQGKLSFSKGRLRLELRDESSQTDTTLILNDERVWLVEQLPKEFGGQLQVAKMKIKGSQKKSQALLAFLLGDTDVWSHFDLVSADKSKKGTRFTLKPRKSAQLPSIVKVEMMLDAKGKKIIELSYLDELENNTVYAFSKVRFGKTVSSEKFSYDPPKNAIVTAY